MLGERDAAANVEEVPPTGWTPHNKVASPPRLYLAKWCLRGELKKRTEVNKIFKRKEESECCFCETETKPPQLGHRGGQAEWGGLGTGRQRPGPEGLRGCEIMI